MSDISMPASTQINLDQGAIDKLVELGSHATGVEIRTVEFSQDGLPSAIPIAIVHGEEPRAVSIKALAEEWRFQPQRRRGVATVGDVASFCALVNRHKTESSVIFAQSDWTRPSLTAVIDYHHIHAENHADNGQHRVHYAFPFSDEWKTWIAHDGKPMDQAQFAVFMEERNIDMVALVEAENAHFAREMGVAAVAAPNQITELARGLEINVGGQIRQNVRLQSGEATISFEEQHTGKDGKAITVPAAFALSIPLFYNDEPITIPVLLRYRIVSGSIVWLYKLFRVDRVVAEAVRAAKQEVAATTDIPVYEGQPEMMANGTPASGV